MAAAPSNDGQNGPGITRIAVTGFKSLATKTEVEIRPLTVLAGANSSGKSSLMQPLLLMKQTLESDFNAAGPFLLSGPYLQFTETKQFLSSVDPTIETSRTLMIDISIGDEFSVGMTFGATPDASFDVLETRGADNLLPRPWRIDRNSSPDNLKSIHPVLFDLWRQRGFTELSVVRYMFYQRVLASSPTNSASIPSEFFVPDSVSLLNSQIRRVVYVAGLRGDQQRKRLLAETNEHGFFWGPFESYVPSLIEFWKKPGHPEKMSELINGLKLLDLASGIETERLSESEVEVRVPRTPSSAGDDFVNIADVGLAVPTVLPVLVALIQAEPGQLVYIEQPELHLHPRAQWRLAEILSQAANRGVRLVIETHSSLLLQGILTCVAKGSITPENVALHWFARNDEGITEVTTANIDPEGRVGNWPVDFDQVELKASNEYLDAVEAKLMASKGA